MSSLQDASALRSLHTRVDATRGDTQNVDQSKIDQYTPEPMSVIIPTLNEATNIAELLSRLGQTLTQASIPCEIIIVDDHSTDNTVSIVETIAQEQTLPIRILTKQGHPGKSFSLTEGFAAAQFNLLAMIDGDLQYPPETLPTMAQQLAHADIVIADRRASYGDADRFRGGLSRIFTSVVAMLFGINTDMQSGLKVFRRTIYDGLTVHSGAWSFDLYLVTHAVFNGYTLANVAINFQERHGGVSKVIPLKVGTELLRVALQLKLMWIIQCLVNVWADQKKKLFPQLYAPQNSPLTIQPTTESTEQVRHYTAWLTTEDHYNNTVSLREESSEYVDAAMTATTMKKKIVRTFAPFQQGFSALRTFTTGQSVFLLVLLLVSIAGLLRFKVDMVIALITAVMAFYVFDLCLMLILSLRSTEQSSEKQIDESIIKALSQANWPRYTVLCPLYREAAVVPQFVQAMEALDYPTNRLQILFLIEDHDVETRNAIQAMSLPNHFKIITVPPGEPRTKPRACNFGLLRATGDYVVIYDAEDIPDPLQLKKAVLTFANHDENLACVQAKLNFYNAEQNLLTRLFTIEYSTWFDLTLPGLQRAQLALPLGGTSNHFRTETLGTLGAWDAFNVTEDCDLGLRLSHYGLKTAVLDSTTYEEANSQWKNWFRQRSRWIKGYMQTYLVHMRQPLRYLYPANWINFFSLQFIIGGKAAILLINPLMWTLLIMYLFFHTTLNNAYHILFPTAALYMGSLCLIFGNFLYAYLHLIGCLKRGQYKLIKWILLMPLYWALSSVASLIALYQLFIKPHYWEKTIHGLHLGKNVGGNPILSETYDTVALPSLKQTQETLA
jgi:cellulose synthase/poly-beta-1,6-N-acetylglucosamine synthase-like glycosyltransferase